MAGPSRDSSIQRYGGFQRHVRSTRQDEFIERFVLRDRLRFKDADFHSNTRLSQPFDAAACD
jgi:hypothetical protein